VWYNRVTENLTELPDFLEHYRQELAQARVETIVKGNIERNLAALPGVTEHRFAQLQEIEAVLNYLNIQLRKIRRRHFQAYLEKYNKALSSRDAEKYVDGEDEVVKYEELINEVALLRNQYLGIIKALDSKNWTLSNITKLRTAGLEDATL
jgi:hypothetical protein